MRSQFERVGGRKVKLGLIQVAAQYGPEVTVESCLEELLELAERCLRDGADLVFMPETYQYKNVRHIPRRELVSRYSEAYKQRCAELARKYAAYVVPWDNEVDDAGNLYNTSYILDRSGQEIGRYRKVHLTRREKEKLAAGTDFPVFDLDFGRVGIMICFDNYYAETARILALRGAELILYPLFGDTLNPGWEIKTRARALDNSVYVAPCCLHSPVHGDYFVYTGLIAPDGEVLGKIEEYGTHRVVEIDLDRPVLTNIRAVKGGCELIKPYLLKTRNTRAYGPLLESVAEQEWDEIEWTEEAKDEGAAAASQAGEQRQQSST
jgi:predicted amidohydrolase